MDKVAEINKAKTSITQPDFLKEDIFKVPTQKEANAAEDVRFSAAPDTVQRMAHSIRNEAVSQYNLDRDVFNQWKDLIGPGLQPPKIISGQRDVMGEYNTLEVWMKKKDGRPIDVVAQDAVETGLIKSPEDIFDALRRLKAPANPSRNAVDYMDEALRIHDYESSIEPQGPSDTGFDFQVEQPDFSAEAPATNKEHYTANLAKARIAGMPLREAVAFARESSITQGQKDAVSAFNKIITANKITDQTFVQFVDSIKVDKEAFQKGYGTEFQADKYAVRGATFPIKNHPVVKALVQFASGAHAGTGYHEAFHVISTNVLTKQEYAVLQTKFGTEENIAESFAKYEKGKTGKEKRTAIKAIFDKISAFLERLRSYFKGNGWRTADDVFRGISEGKAVRVVGRTGSVVSYHSEDMFPGTKENVVLSFERLVADGKRRGLNFPDAVREAKAKLSESARLSNEKGSPAQSDKQRGFSDASGVRGFGTNQRGQGELYQAERKDQTQTPEFKQWFGDSVVTDNGKPMSQGGKPLVVYHGTTHSFSEFKTDLANIENHYGKAFYFTDSKRDVTKNYAGEGPDLAQRIELRAERVFQEMFDGKTEPKFNSTRYEKAMDKARATARKELTGGGQTVLETYVRMENPVIIDGPGATRFEINFDEESGEESGSGVGLYESVLRAAGNFGVDGQAIWGDVTQNLEPGDFSAKEFEEAMRNSEKVAYIEDENGVLASNEFVKEVYREAGFDGIIMDADATFGSGRKMGKSMAMDDGAKHYIVFNPTQIKSATGNTGAFDPKNPSILYQAEKTGLVDESVYEKTARCSVLAV
ncbi:MAG: hypothetical protein IPP68_12340 [Elusimicrobia bacterium]|nr:hypothetical protein [Elusimicrobiota bacterium]